MLETSLLREMRNTPPVGNKLLSAALDLLTARLPKAWHWKLVGEASAPGRRTDALLEVRSPDGGRGVLTIEAKRQVDPRDVPFLAHQLHPREEAAPMVVAPYLGQRTRERLREAGIGYVDLTNNIWLVLDRPALFIEGMGAQSDPWRQERPARSLRGRKAGRIVRALCDFQPPLGTRELAAKATTDPGYVSRVLRLLEREDLIQREARGPVTTVDWRGLIRRWAENYSFLRSNATATYLEPRGLQALMSKLQKAEFPYAVSGSLAASRVAVAAPSRLASVYTDDAEQAAASLGLHSAEAGANVILAEPFDPVVYQRAWKGNGVRFAAISQVAADLLTSPGRAPTEADELLAWMAENEHAWRSRS
jgi:hypothetical protein